MRWAKAELFRSVETEKDRLGNSITKPEFVAFIRIRATAWNVEEIQQLGQTFTKTHRKFITPHKFCKTKGETPCSINLNGEKYNVESVKKIGDRFTALTVKAVKEVMRR